MAGRTSRVRQAQRDVERPGQRRQAARTTARGPVEGAAQRIAELAFGTEYPRSGSRRGAALRALAVSAFSEKRFGDVRHDRTADAKISAKQVGRRRLHAG